MSFQVETPNPHPSLDTSVNVSSAPSEGRHTELPPSKHLKTSDVFDPAKSQTTRDALNEWFRHIVTGNLKQVPGKLNLNSRTHFDFTPS